MFELLRYAGARWGSAWIEQAAFAYFAEAGPDAEGLDPQLFLPWLVHHWRVEGQPLREWFLAARGSRVSGEERAWLEAQREVVVTAWQVLEVRRGEGLQVQHLLGPGEYFVQEALGSQQLAPGDTVLGRRVSAPGSSVFCGLYPRPLGALDAEDFVAAARLELAVPEPRPVPPALLQEEDTALALIHLWREHVARADAEDAGLFEPPH